MGFRKTAISLIVISLVTAGVAGVYLWYNFTSRSNLLLVVPSDASWYYHFQTKKIRSIAKGDMPVYLDSLRRVMRQLPVFEKVKEPEEVGINLYSDVIAFSNQYGWFLALSVNSEPRLNRFVTEVMPAGLKGGIIHSQYCDFIKGYNKNLYLAWKHKACVIYIPSDTVENLKRTEAAMATVFNHTEDKSIASNKQVQALYDADCQVVCYGKDPSTVITHGVNLSGTTAMFTYPSKSDGKQEPSPLYLFRKSGMALNETDAGRLLTSDNNLNSGEYLNLSFRRFYEILKPFSK